MKRRLILALLLAFLTAGTASAHHRKFHQMDDFDMSRGMDCEKLYIGIQKLDKILSVIKTGPMHDQLQDRRDWLRMFFWHQCEVA